jgi:hypothetical protein
MNLAFAVTDVYQTSERGATDSKYETNSTRTFFPL